MSLVLIYNYNLNILIRDILHQKQRAIKNWKRVITGRF